MVAVAGPVTGYTLVLPPGWARIPLKAGTTEAIDAVLATAFDLPVDAAQPEDLQAREASRAGLLELCTAAADNGGLDAYVPVHGPYAGMSFVVASVCSASVESPEPALVVQRLARASGARAVTVDGVRGSRTEALAPGASAGSAGPTRRVDYLIPVPGDDGRWIVASLAVTSMDDPVGPAVDLLVELFDAIMSTFRWKAALA